MLQIRPARYGDAEVAFDIRLQAIRHQCIAVYTPEQVQAWTQVPLTDRYRASVERQYQIAWWDEVAVATGLIDFQSRELGALFVLPAYMGQGIGKAMIQHLERLAIAAGLDEIHLAAAATARGRALAVRLEGRFWPIAACRERPLPTAGIACS